MKILIDDLLKDSSWWVRFKTWCMLKCFKLIGVRYIHFYPFGQITFQNENGEVIHGFTISNREIVKELCSYTNNKHAMIDLKSKEVTL